jgi:hypothetical protein
MIVANSEGTHQVMIKFSPYHHEKLLHMTLRRSADLGRRVSMGFVLQEMIEERLQSEKPELRSADLFGSRE